MAYAVSRIANASVMAYAVSLLTNLYPIHTN